MDLEKLSKSTVKAINMAQTVIQNARDKGFTPLEIILAGIAQAKIATMMIGQDPDMVIKELGDMPIKELFEEVKEEV